jgi:hypothetical protein
MCSWSRGAIFFNHKVFSVLFRLNFVNLRSDPQFLVDFVKKITKSPREIPRVFVPESRVITSDFAFVTT